MHLRFDQGTILCTDLPAELHPDELPGVIWDPRINQLRAPAHFYAEIISRLQAKKIGVTDEVRTTLSRPQPTPSPSLRPYQEAALQAWMLAGNRGIIALPTGSGKTRVAVAAIAQTGAPTLCLVPTRILLAQWCHELSNKLQTSIGCYGDGERNLQPITVSTFESAYRRMAQFGNEFELLVIDEAHHFGVGMRDEALEMSIAAKRLGLTATPPTNDTANEQLKRLIGPTVYQCSVGDLAGKYLAELDLITLTLALSDEERRLYDMERARFKPVCRQFFRLHPLASWSDFVRVSRQSSTGRQALDSWRRARRLVAFTKAKRETVRMLLHRHRDCRVLIFTADNDTAYAIARENLVMPITCEIGRKERAEMLERFAGYEIRALVSSRVLNEGIDVPDAQVGIVVGGTHGEREHIQRIGRLLRPSPGKRATIYELVAGGTSEVNQSAKRRRAVG